MNNKKLKMAAFIGLAALLVSCASVQEPLESEESVSPPDHSLIFQESLETALEQETPEKWVGLLNQGMDTYPDLVASSLENFITQEISLAEDCLVREDFDRSLYHCRNLLALRSFNEGDIEALMGDLVFQLLEQKDFLLSAQFSDLLAQFNEDGVDPYLYLSKDRPTRQALSEVLVEIHVERVWNTDTGLERRNYPYFSGSGIIIGADKVLTAYHVIESVFYPETDDYTITCHLIDGSVQDMTVLSWDSLNDFAVLSLEEPLENFLPPETLFGNSTELTVGDRIYSYGSSYGYTETLSEGLVTTISRPAFEVGEWIQFDASIAPGASGGMLIDEKNRLQGLIVAGVNDEEINFAVPADSIIRNLNSLLDGNTRMTPWLGLILSPDEDVTMVEYAFPSSPLTTFGLVEGTVITKIGGIPVSEIEDAQKTLSLFSPGNVCPITMRNPGEEETTYWFVLPRRPEFAIFSAAYEQDRFSTLYPTFGFELNQEETEVKSYYENGEKVSMRFYQVSRVRDDSFPYCAGIRSGHLVGIIKDEYSERGRVLRIFHVLPEWEIDEMEDLGDFIYTFYQGVYNENIL